MRESLCCLMVLAGLLNSCAVVPLSAQSSSDGHLGSPEIVPSFIGWGFTARPERRIDTIILHTINNPAQEDKLSLPSIMAILKKYQVGAHYLILRDGSVFQLVEEANIAWHAGKSRLPVAPFRSNVNEFSLGIEIANSEDSLMTDAQYAALILLVQDVKSRHSIKHIFGHKDIAPGRKTDPWNFDWERFHRAISNRGD